MIKKVTDTLRNTNYLIGIFVFLFVSATSTGLLAQRTVNVSQGFGTLNTAIDGDTTATGERVDSNTVYVLSSGGTYLLDGSIEHRGYHLTIVAEDGYTERPRLIPAVDNGGESSRPFRPRGDLTLRGLYFTSEDEEGGLNTRMVRISENDVIISIDDSHMDKDGQSAFRVDGTGVSIFLTNSIISNIGSTSSPNNGRGIDDRGNDMNTVYIENCTFYNLTSQVLRDDGGHIRRAHINQNTFYNVGINPAVELGPVVDAKVLNNLFYNTNFYGYNTNDQETPSAMISMDFLSPDDEAEFGAQTAQVAWNNFYLDQAIIDAYPDSVAPFANLDSLTSTFVSAADSATLIDEMLTFTSAPAIPTNIVTSWWTTPDGDQPEFDNANAPFDFGYSTASSSTAGNDGQQLGARTWFGVLTSNEEEESGSLTTPTSFELLGNYPNPFNPTTNIAFSLPEASVVSVEVFNIVGQRVMTIPAQRFTAGANQTINIDASSLSSGIYLYRVSARSATNTMLQTGRMTLIK